MILHFKFNYYYIFFTNLQYYLNNCSGLYYSRINLLLGSRPSSALLGWRARVPLHRRVLSASHHIFLILELVRSQPSHLLPVQLLLQLNSFHIVLVGLLLAYVLEALLQNLKV